MPTNPLNAIWRRLDRDPPVFFGDQIDFMFGDSREQIFALGLLRADQPTRSATCPECGYGGRLLCERNTKTGSVILSCRTCGPVHIDPESLQQWAINIGKVLDVVQTTASLRGTVTETVPNHVWHLGRAAWGGCGREAYLLRSLHEGNRAVAVDAIGTHPRAVLFFPTESAALRWGGVTPNPVVGLDAVLKLASDGFTFDKWVVEGRLADTAVPAKKPRAKNGALLANIGRLTEEMVTFLRNAREYAISTREIKKEAALLPRPSKKALGELAGLEAYEVTRCFADEAARELNLYWEMALDLNQIMKFSGPVGSGSEA